MTIGGYELDVNRMMHEISLECAKIEINMSKEYGSLNNEDDISRYLERMLSSYVANFEHLSKKSEEDLKALLADE